MPRRGSFGLSRVLDSRQVRESLAQVGPSSPSPSSSDGSVKSDDLEEDVKGYGGKQDYQEQYNSKQQNYNKNPCPENVDPRIWASTKTVRSLKDLGDDTLRKYWFQRYRLFSRYDSGIRMDPQGWWSVTPEQIAVQIAARCCCNCIVDAFCGVGGNTIQFAMYCEQVIAIDSSRLRLELARHNARIYGVEDKITFVHADFITWARERIAEQQREQDDEEDATMNGYRNSTPPIDVIFLSPPWGGMDYLKEDNSSILQTDSINDSSVANGDTLTAATDKTQYNRYSMDRLEPISGQELYTLASLLTHNLAFFLPRNVNLDELARLSYPNPVEIEEEWTGPKLKAITAYYGDLVSKPSLDSLELES